MISRQIRLLLAITLAASIATAIMPALGATPANTSFERTWNRTDQPVITEQADRTWMWGPAAFTGAMLEPTTDLPGIGRVVQYFDKSRMEITTDPTVNRNSIWYVTNGLLARELVTGMLQTGNEDFEPRAPAQVNVAGDGDDPTGPIYASFLGVLDDPPLPVGSTITSRLSRAGTISDDPGLATRGVTTAYLVPETNHAIAAPFWDFMNSTGTVSDDGFSRTGPLFPNPFYATGFPISEAYWASVKVANVYTDVLVQVFERRVLTYTPGNPPGWQVEAGNVGRHYFEWRYGMTPPDYVDAPGGSFAPLGPAPLPSNNPDLNGQVSFVVTNQSPSPLTISFSGPASVTIELAGCPECQIYDTPPDSCGSTAPSETVTLPPGSYAATSTRPGANVQPLGGIWTLLPNSSYGVCFFTIR